MEMKTGELAGQVAWVSGAGTGNGEVIAERLLSGGTRVALVGRRLEPLQTLQRRIDPEGARTLALQADVRSIDAIGHTIDATLQRFGALHIAVNNAGITGPAGVALQNVDVETWREVMNTDVSGVFYGMKHQIPAMLQSGGGVILNLSSANGLVGLAGMAAYTAAKHAVIGLTRSAALELAEQGIRVCAIAPGYVATSRILESGPDAVAYMAQQHPMKRLASPQEVAELAAYLASPRAAFITGSVHSIDGGYTAQ